MPLEGQVHQRGVDDVVLMVPKGYLRAAQLLGNVEELFAALPGTEKAGGLALSRMLRLSRRLALSRMLRLSRSRSLIKKELEEKGYENY